MEIRQYPSKNYSPGRRKYGTQTEQVLAIMFHKTAGKYPGCRDWLCNPESKVSAHYVISRAGEIDQLVALCDTAWHGGIVNKPSWDLYNQMGFNPNRWTIGIELEDYDGDGEPGLTEPQYQALLWLVNKLIAEYKIPIDTEHEVGHYRVDSVNRPNCPGPDFPWTRLFADLKGENTMPEWKQKIMDAALEIRLIEPNKHTADDTSTVWFVLMVVLNAIKYIKEVIINGRII